MVTIIRQPDDGKETLGSLTTQGFTSDTLERPWKNNQHGVSCIPTGIYNCVKVPATTHIPYQHISILNVDGRIGVCMHRGNFFSDSEGCILIGKGFADLNKDGEKDVEYSKPTFDDFMNAVPDSFQLEIKYADAV